MISEKVNKIVNEALGDGVFPGAVVMVEKGGIIALSLARGFRQIFPRRELMTMDTLFDLASLTKPLATTTTFLSLCDREKIRLDSTTGKFIPRLNSKTAEVTLFQLLTHTSCLPPVPEIFRMFPKEEDINSKTALDHLYTLAPIMQPGSSVIYSCTGYILLAQILKKVAGCSLSQAFNELIVKPGAFEGLMFNPDPSYRDMCAATEFCSWRRRWLKGEVHDENSFCLAGEGGNAGLFGTAAGVMKLLSLFTPNGILDGKMVLSREYVQMMARCQTGGLSPGRALGFLTQDRDSFAGPEFSRGAFGHTGFTGTSVWIDPDRELKIVILTNRVHLGRETTADKIKRFRIAIHQAILQD